MTISHCPICWGNPKTGYTPEAMLAVMRGARFIPLTDINPHVPDECGSCGQVQYFPATEIDHELATEAYADIRKMRSDVVTTEAVVPSKGYVALRDDDPKGQVGTRNSLPPSLHKGPAVKPAPGPTCSSGSSGKQSVTTFIIGFLLIVAALIILM
jgi:hypothetical protein